MFCLTPFDHKQKRFHCILAELTLSDHGWWLRRWLFVVFLGERRHRRWRLCYYFFEYWYPWGWVASRSNQKWDTLRWLSQLVVTFLGFSLGEGSDSDKNFNAFFWHRNYDFEVSKLFNNTMKIERRLKAIKSQKIEIFSEKIN